MVTRFIRRVYHTARGMVTRVTPVRAGLITAIIKKDPATVTMLVRIWARSVEMQVATTSTS